MLTPDWKIKLLGVGTVASLFINVACAHGIAMAMTLATARHYSDDTKIFIAGILTVGICISLVTFFVCLYFLISKYSKKEEAERQAYKEEI